MLSKGFKYSGVHTVDGRNQHVIENKRNSENQTHWEWQVASFSFVKGLMFFMRRGQKTHTTGLFKCKQTGELVQLRIKH